MKFRKTKQSEREVYRYPVCIQDGKGGYREEYIEIKPGENDVTEVNIKTLHSLDDSEVYYNIKNSRPMLTDKQKAEVKEWMDKHPGEMIHKNWTFSIEALTEEGVDQDKSSILASASYDPFQDESDEVEHLREVAKTFTPKQKEIYTRVLLNGEPQVKVAEELGITKQAVRSCKNKIIARIKKAF